ncbi:hypothetical protein [Erythrobacter donghaensis]|uniref:hypothetical protein n=1 Tax=Erythrobacter donghaensis TaxID=267135 RepID=UPI000A3B0283|nr:hypothetical protein [Erythrobacter donghaensis]
MQIEHLLIFALGLSLLGCTDGPVRSPVCDAFESPGKHLGEPMKFEALVVYRDGAFISPATDCGTKGLGVRADIQQIYSAPIFLRSRDMSTSEKPYAVRMNVEGVFRPGNPDQLHGSDFIFEVASYESARLVVSERAYDWLEEPPPAPATYDTPINSR